MDIGVVVKVKAISPLLMRLLFGSKVILVVA